MAQGREQEAIDAFFDNYVQSQGRDYVVVEGERHVLGHDSDAWDLRKAYPSHDYRKDLEKIPESPVKQGLRNLLHMPLKELMRLPFKELRDSGDFIGLPNDMREAINEILGTPDGPTDEQYKRVNELMEKHLKR
jgi:hypothetical protein